MFRRSEKKIKAVFKLQFQATKVPQLKAKSLMISLIPVDVGKPTLRLPKAPILEGTCTWENPVYETVKLLKETKTGRIREKFYYVVVSTGSSKSGFLGEVSVDFADLADAIKPINLILPLQTSKSGTILHVTVQKMQGEGPDSRHEENESYDQHLDIETDSHCIRGKGLQSSESDELSEYASQHDEQNQSLEDAEPANEDIETLRSRMKMLERKLEVSELEIQSIRKQIVKETKKGEQLTGQIVSLEEEKEALKAKCEQLRSSQAWDVEMVPGNRQEDINDLRTMLEDTKLELQHQKHSNKKCKVQLQQIQDSNSEYVLAMRELTKKLDKKNTEISLVSNRIKALHSGSENRTSPIRETDWEKESTAQRDEGSEVIEAIEKLETDVEFLKKEKEKLVMEAERFRQEREHLETENRETHSKLEQTERDKVEIKRRYNDLSAQAKQFENRIAYLESENKRQALQYADSLNVIDELEFQVESLHEELKKRGKLFELNLEALTAENAELEQRVMNAEHALRESREGNAGVVQKLQGEMLELSTETSTRIQEHEKLAKQANAEASYLRKENEILEDLLRKAEEELQKMRNQHELGNAEQSKLNEGTTECSNDSVITETETTNRHESVQNKELEILQTWKSEKEDLERRLTSVKAEAERMSKENASMKLQIDQKRTKEDNLHLEVKTLRLKNKEAKDQLAEKEREKQHLQKEITKLQSDLCKREQKQSVEVDNGKSTSTNNDLMHTKDFPTACQSPGSVDNSSLLSEVASLKEKNTSMEQELKEMRERYSEISLKFAEVEGERQKLVMTIRNRVKKT